MEILDYFDDNRQFLGQASREEVHRKGLWHQTFHAWLIGQEEEPYLIFQKRSLQKDHQAGLFDISAAGHLLTQEGPEDGGFREFEEELGLKVAPEEFIALGVKTDVSQLGDYINREFCHTYFIENRFTWTDFKLQVEELSGLLKLNLSQAFKLFGEGQEQVPAIYFSADKEGRLEAPQNIELNKKAILPHPDYLKVCIMVERFYEGKKFLSI